MSLDAASIFSVVGKTAVVTGASGYLGRTFVQSLLANGARVIALGRSERVEREVTQWRRAFGAKSIEGFQIDMYDRNALTLTLDRISSEEAHIDILVNNAHELGPATGFNTASGSLEESSFDQWTRNLACGVHWPALVTQRLGLGMCRRGAGSIINISTMYALVAPKPKLYDGTTYVNPPAYSASKAALLSFTRYVASFWGQYGVRANAILPGPFSNTEDRGPNAVGMDDPFLDRLKANTCLGRIGRADELAGALLFLASDASSYMTGQALVIDGGWTII